MSDFCTLWPGGPKFRQSGHFPLGTDSVLLADFVNLSSLRRGIDLGCGSGIIALLLLCRDERLKMTGIDILPEAVETARENMSENGLEDRGDIVAADIRVCREQFKTGAFDFAAANPPYFAAGRGYTSPNGARAAARDERSCSLSELCSAAAYLVRTGGGFFLVHRAERLSEVFCAMTSAGIEPKRLRLVQHEASSVPSLALIEGRRGGGPGLKIEPPLILSENGSDSAEARRIYHLGGKTE